MDILGMGTADLLASGSASAGALGLEDDIFGGLDMEGPFDGWDMNLMDMT
jgi:hypothetical protein